MGVPTEQVTGRAPGGQVVSQRHVYSRDEEGEPLQLLEGEPLSLSQGESTGVSASNSQMRETIQHNI